MSDSLGPHGLQDTRLLCPVLYLPEFAQTHVHWVGDAIQLEQPLLPPSPPTFKSFPALGSSPMGLFSSGGQSIGASTSASVLPMNIQYWFPLSLTGLSSLQSKRLSRIFFRTAIWKHQFFSPQAGFVPFFSPSLARFMSFQRGTALPIMYQRCMITTWFNTWINWHLSVFSNRKLPWFPF